MKIKKVSTYENLQLVNLDGSRPRGEQSRLAKTFTDKEYNMRFSNNGTGVIIEGKPGDNMCIFFVPFANIPYVVCESEEQYDSGSAAEKTAPRPAKKAE